MSASRQGDDVLGRWRSRRRTRRGAPGARGGASWTASLMPDGRLAVLIVEAHGPGLVAAIGTSALTGAFAAAALDAASLDALLATLRATADDVIREPVAAFVALLDDTGRLEWGTAGHPGGHLVTAGGATTAIGGGGGRLGTSLIIRTRGVVEVPDDGLVVIASTALRGDDEPAWQAALVELAPAGGALAQLVVERARGRDTDALVVVIRAHAPKAATVRAWQTPSGSGTAS